MSSLTSMTGFGRASSAGAGVVIEVEIKSWNHKGFDAQIRLPDAYAHLEAPVREELAGRAGRGKILLAVRIRGEVPGREVVFHEPLVRAVFEPYQRLAAQLGVPPVLTAGDLLELPGAVEIVETAQDAVGERIRATIREAIAAWDETRRREGERMADAMREQAGKLDKAAEVIRARAAVTPKERAARLRTRVADLVAHVPSGVDEKRLELEISLLAEKSDIQEEIVRFAAHLARLHKLLESAKGDSADRTQPVGAELGFLLQELLREMNTTGSKTSDLETVKAVIAAKTAIERIKELAANVV